MDYKKVLLGGMAVCAAFAFMASSGVQAQVSRTYLAGYLGLNTYGAQDFSGANAVSGNLEQNNAVSFAGALGLRLSKQVRLEGELSYRKPEITKINTSAGSFNAGGSVKQWAGLLNVYYDFDTNWKIKPYVSAGAGLSYFEGDLQASGTGQRFDDSGYGFTYQAGAGFKYRPRDNLSYTFGYRYLDTLEIDMGGLDLDYSSHEFRIGLEYDLDWGRK